MKIALVAACDRNNYGDILLPVLLENELKSKFKDKIDIQYYGLKKADLRKIGGRKVLPLHKIDDKTDVVIVAGGEVIGGTYTAMFMYFQDNKISKLAIRFFNHFFERFTNKIAKIALHGKMSYPWLVLSCNKNQKVFYNAIGCINLDNLSEKGKQEVSQVITRSDLFSVRDKKSLENVSALDRSKKTNLVPDTAILMEHYYASSRLQNLISGYIRGLKLREKKYFVLQVNRFDGKNIEDKIAGVISRIYDELGIACVLLPIGRAAFHEDQVPLKKIGRLSKNCSSIYIKENTVFDTMFVISNSIAYTGTSLHGAITAASYNVPHTVLLKSAKKAQFFIDTWKTSEKLYVESARDLYDFIKQCGIDREYMLNKDNISRAKGLVKSYYGKMIEEMGCTSNRGGEKKILNV